MSPVLDASVFIAAISPAERHHVQAKGLFDSHADSEQFLVPDLFRVEVVAGLARRREPDELIAAVDAIIRGPRFCACALEPRLVERAADVARRAHLRAYDAVYVALALTWNEPLFTLDAEVVARCSVAFPQLQAHTAP